MLVGFAKDHTNAFNGLRWTCPPMPYFSAFLTLGPIRGQMPLSAAYKGTVGFFCTRHTVRKASVH